MRRPVHEAPFFSGTIFAEAGGCNNQKTFLPLVCISEMNYRPGLIQPGRGLRQMEPF